MKKTKRQVSLVLLILFVITTTLAGQQHNSYKFIEPNISITYDSNLFKIGSRYSNESYGTESYDFIYLPPTKKVTFHIKANQPREYPPKEVRDKRLLAGIEEIKNSGNDSIAIVSIDQRPREINGFSCVGFTGQDKTSPQYSTLIKAHHFSENDNTEIIYFSKGKDLEEEYQLFKSILSGFKSYSKKEIENEERLIKNKYTVIITPAKTEIEKFKYSPKTYLGFVSVKEKLEHKIAEARVSFLGGFELFEPGENGQVLILANDQDKGKINKRGELVLFNSFGKKVKLPFSFSYENTGTW